MATTTMPAYQPPFTGGVMNLAATPTDVRSTGFGPPGVGGTTPPPNTVQIGDTAFATAGAKTNATIPYMRIASTHDGDTMKAYVPNEVAPTGLRPTQGLVGNKLAWLRPHKVRVKDRPPSNEAFTLQQRVGQVDQVMATTEYVNAVLQSQHFQMMGAAKAIDPNALLFPTNAAAYTASSCPFLKANILPGLGGPTPTVNVLDNDKLKAGVYMWTPDGVILSKLGEEMSPTGALANMAARYGETYNVAIRGPAFMTEFSRGVAEHLTAPGDHVFAVLVVDMVLATTGSGADRLKTAAETLHAEMTKQDTTNKVSFQRRDAERQVREDFITALVGSDRPRATQANFKAVRGSAGSSSTVAFANPRYILMTGSFMARCAGRDSPRGQEATPESVPSRCGLYAATDAGNETLFAETIVGGWDIGYVIDAAATVYDRGPLDSLRFSAANSGIKAGSTTINTYVAPRWLTSEEIKLQYT